jgi:predicted anti-sigma-YlaC factor YlaD
MRCDLAREALSAQLDDELTPLEEDALASHLRGCDACQSHARDLGALHRGLRVRTADPVPDLTRTIMATAAPHLPDPHATRRRRTTGPAPTAATARWARAGLLVVALGQLLLALPEFAGHSHAGHAAHTTRDLGAFGVALAVGMLVVAWQPHRASGLLPMTFALTSALTVTGLIDVVLGHSGRWGQAPHFLELLGLVLLWYLSRTTTTRAPASPVTTGPDPRVHHLAV